MRYLFIVLVFALLGGASCASKKSPSSHKKVVYGPEYQKRLNKHRSQREVEIAIDGFWQEYSRTISKKRMAQRQLAFTDSLKISIRKDSLTRFYDTHGRISSGRLAKKKNGYHLGNGQVFESIRRVGDTIILGNGNGFTYLKKVRGFYTKPFAPVRTGSDEIVDLSGSFLLGKWKVYKKEDPLFSRKKKYLHSIDIKDKHADGTFAIYGSYYNAELLKKKPGYLKVDDAKSLSLHLAKEKEQAYSIRKAANGELILIQNGVTYYLKNLSK